MAKLDALTKVREALNEAEAEIHNPGQGRASGRDVLTLISAAREKIKRLEVEAHAEACA